MLPLGFLSLLCSNDTVRGVYDKSTCVTERTNMKNHEWATLGINEKGCTKIVVWKCASDETAIDKLICNIIFKRVFVRAVFLQVANLSILPCRWLGSPPSVVCVVCRHQFLALREPFVHSRAIPWDFLVQQQALH